MSISTDYPRPVLVNGYSCRNCDEVAEAKKNIDPADASKTPTQKAAETPAVSFGGSLAGLNALQGPAEAGAPSAQPLGSCVNVCC